MLPPGLLHLLIKLHQAFVMSHRESHVIHNVLFSVIPLLPGIAPRLRHCARRPANSSSRDVDKSSHPAIEASDHS